MSHLIQVSIGPVQGFIAASRKTRDLKMGSDILQALAKTAAKELAKHGRLIFPSHPDEPAANIILARLDTGDPAEVAKSVEAAVRTELDDRMDQVLREQQMKLFVAEPQEAKEQARATLEVFVAWSALDGSYAEARQKLAIEMAARKALRDFMSSPEKGDGRPKSPLDPGLAGVVMLGEGWQVNADAQKRLHLKPREHLDGLGLLKRFGKFEARDEGRYESTRTISVLDALARAGVEVADFNAHLKGTDLDAGDVILSSQWEGLGDTAKTELLSLKRKVKAAWEEHQSENPTAASLRPYYAIIHADGDRMGELLDKLADSGEDDHRQFSQKLSEFALAVPALVRRHHGLPVYSGGDDVLALCPCGVMLDLAADLREKFDEIVGSWARQRGAPEPSLTVGVAVVHSMENLQKGVALAQRMEKLGKRHVTENGKKDALAIGVQPRGGGLHSYVSHWKNDPVKELKQAMELLATGQVPRGFPYEVQRLAMEVAPLGRSSNLSNTSVVDLSVRELKRIALRKSDRSGVAATLTLPDWSSSPEGLQKYADMLRVAHFLTRGEH